MLLPAILICLTIHELSHALAARSLGDDTAYVQGRMTLNPIAHIDLIGLICMLIAGIGWAKPVPVNPYNFRMKNKKLGMAITAFAGPFSNLILSFVCLLAYFLIAFYSNNRVLLALGDFLSILASLSIGLMAFNLLPIPPLDGSKVILPLLPDRMIATVNRIQPYIQLVMLILLALGFLDGVIGTVRNFFLNLLLDLIRLIFTSAGII
ncbi:MAG: site-2 protease family protein [Clostridia bacterium]|nr:site-2 protease family protein [Clostridia bacterium]